MWGARSHVDRACGAPHRKARDTPRKSLRRCEFGGRRDRAATHEDAMRLANAKRSCVGRASSQTGATQIAGRLTARCRAPQRTPPRCRLPPGCRLAHRFRNACTWTAERTGKQLHRGCRRDARAPLPRGAWHLNYKGARPGNALCGLFAHQAEATGALRAAKAHAPRLHLLSF